jgi:SAM-dependent methyltransferase
MQKVLWISKQNIRNFLSLPKQLLAWQNNLVAWQRFWHSYESYKQLATIDEQPELKNIYPCLGDDTAETVIEPTYFYQDTWAFEKIVNQRPSQHIDVGSHHTFVALLSKVLPVTMVDIRPLSLPLESLKFEQGSILDLPFADASIESLSSLCVVEHIGLGRYGDPLDPQGTEKAIAELKRVIKPNGNLYISLPVDDENRTFFNAHRAFREEYIQEIVQPLKIIEKRYIHGNKFLLQNLGGFAIGLYHLHNRA